MTLRAMQGGLERRGGRSGAPWTARERVAGRGNSSRLWMGKQLAPDLTGGDHRCFQGTRGIHREVKAHVVASGSQGQRQDSLGVLLRLCDTLATETPGA